jgi:hypothetical protein
VTHDGDLCGAFPSSSGVRLADRSNNAVLEILVPVLPTILLHVFGNFSLFSLFELWLLRQTKQTFLCSGFRISTSKLTPLKVGRIFISLRTWGGADQSTGRGVFATEIIPAKTVIEVCPVLVLGLNENKKHIEYTSLYHYT